MTNPIVSELQSRLPNTTVRPSSAGSDAWIDHLAEEDVGQFYKAVRELGLTTEAPTGRDNGVFAAWVSE